eukprot:1169337-Rhodomonas_salina.1
MVTVATIGILLVVTMVGLRSRIEPGEVKRGDLGAGTGPVCDSNRQQERVRCTAGTGPAQVFSNRYVVGGGEVKRAGTGPATI